MRFLAIEHVLPSRAVTNDEVKAKVREASAAHLSPADLNGLDSMMDGVFASCGTTVRYHRAPGERAGDLSIAAARRALDKSGLDPADIDLVMYVGIGRGFLEPASGTLYTDQLGLVNATTFDVLDACASWIRAVHLARVYLQTGTYKNIMIINSEFEGIEAHRFELKSLREFEHWHPSVTIGEATTATVLSGSADDDDDDQFQISWRTSGDKRSMCYIPLPNYEQYRFDTPSAPRSQAAGGWKTIPPMQFVSYGMQLMDAGLHQTIDHFRDEPQFKDFDPEIIFTHAASDGMVARAVTELGLDPERVRFYHRKFANLVSASVPTAMSDSIASGDLKPGMRTMISVASAGVTTALASFVYRT